MAYLNLTKVNLMATSPTQLSLKKLREEGYTVQVVEYWNSFARIRIDLFGFIDIIALKGKEVLAVQTTSASNMSARCKKIADHENLGSVREAGWTIHVHGWHQDDKRKWHCKVKDIS
jgi:hypothetical protein